MTDHILSVSADDYDGRKLDIWCLECDESVAEDLDKITLGILQALSTEHNRTVTT